MRDQDKGGGRFPGGIAGLAPAPGSPSPGTSRRWGLWVSEKFLWNLKSSEFSWRFSTFLAINYCDNWLSRTKNKTQKPFFLHFVLWFVVFKEGAKAIGKNCRYSLEFPQFWMIFINKIYQNWCKIRNNLK